MTGFGGHDRPGCRDGSLVSERASGRHDGRWGRRRPRDDVVQCPVDMQVPGVGSVREHKMMKKGRGHQAVRWDDGISRLWGRRVRQSG